MEPIQGGLLERLLVCLPDPAPKPHYGLLRSVRNLGTESFELQGCLRPPDGGWHTLLPCVPPGERSSSGGYALPYGPVEASGGIWLPRGTLLRVVPLDAPAASAAPLLLSVVGEAIDVVVPAAAAASSPR